MAYVMFVALEVTAKSFNSKTKKYWRENNLWLDSYKPIDKNVPKLTVRRLMGVSADDSSLIQKILEANYEPKGDTIKWRTEQVRNLTLFRLSSYSRVRIAPLNSVLVIKLVFSESEISEISKFKRLNSKTYYEVLEPLKLADSIDKSSAVHPVIGTMSPEGDAWEEGVRDGWIHIQGGYIQERILEATVSRVAIERALLNWAVSREQGLFRLIKPALIGYRLRQWRVEFLSDWETITRGQHLLRESLNLPRVREELLSISKSWWTVVGTASTLAAFVVAILSLSN